MTELNEIAAALVAFQTEMPVVHKGKTAKVEMKSGGQYTYTYADLADVTEAAMPLLTKHGLSFSACPRLGEQGYELAGVLLHSSGQVLEGSLPIQGRSPQEIGSSLTYARRYLLGCMTGIVTDDDDDGSAAQRRPEQLATPMTAKTKGHLFALFTQKGVEEDQQLAGANRILGTSYDSRSQFTEQDAKKIIAALNQRPDAAPAVTAEDAFPPEASA